MKKEYTKKDLEENTEYWRWQFYGKVLNPDKVIPFTSDKQEVKK